MLQISYVAFQKRYFLRVKLLLLRKFFEISSLKKIFSWAHLEIPLEIEVKVTANHQIEGRYNDLNEKDTYRPCM